MENLHRHYADNHAVKGISFELNQGDILGFLGPNGAGKSSTMQILSGVLAPSEGRILINGIDLLDQPRKAKSHIGYLPEKPPLYPELTVDEYLRFSGQLRRIPKTDLNDAVTMAKQRCGLEQVGRRLIANLSKGYQQRVGIAQAIIHQPDIVILDEPTVGLDPIQIREIRLLIGQLGEQHGVILSTHILPEVQAICTRVQVINQGQLVFNGNMDSLNQRMESRSIILAFKQPPTTQQLLELEGIEQVNELAAGRFRIQTSPDQDAAEQITRSAVNNGWGLLEMTPEKQTLENIFVELTSGDTTKNNPAEQAA